MARTKGLSMLDLAFFVLESAERVGNVGPLAILKPPAGYKSGGHFADWLMQRMQKKPVAEPFDDLLKTKIPGIATNGNPAIDAILKDHGRRQR